MLLRKQKFKLSVLRTVRKMQHTNPIRSICDHLLGEHHTLSHRLAVGFVVIMLGVTTVQGAHHVSSIWVLAYMIDAGGYALHGVGLMPYLELIQNWRNNSDDNRRKGKTISDSQGNRSNASSDGDANL